MARVTEIDPMTYVKCNKCGCTERAYEWVDGWCPKKGCKGDGVIIGGRQNK